MTPGLIRDLFAYNSWADARILDALAEVPEDAYMRDLKSSHGGLHGTAVHAMFARQVWLLRWEGRPTDEAYATAKESTTLDSLRRAWTRIERDTSAWLDAHLTDDFLDGTFEMKTLKGEVFSHRYGESMVHLVNHSTYHRGQIAGMMRQLGFRPPATDYVLFVRERG